MATASEMDVVDVDMENIEHQNGKIENIELELNTCYWVHITHIVDPYNFYARPSEYVSIIEKLESSKPLRKPTSWNIGDVVTINLNAVKEHPKYARGKILQINMKQDSSDCDIFILDYGYFKKAIPMDNIWECAQEFTFMPPLAIHCRLGNCAPHDPSVGWKQETIHAFKYYVHDQIVRMEIWEKSEAQYIVDIYNNCPAHIASVYGLA